MRAAPNLLILFVLAIAAPSVSTAQNDGTPQGRVFRFNAENAVMLREIGAVVGVEGKTLKIVMIPPPDRRPEGMAGADLQQGDEVGMANGKRLAGINDLRSAYEATAAGAEFKLGVRRDGRPIIVTFTRKSDKDMPGGPMIIRRTGGDDNADFFPALGFGLERAKDGVVVVEILPNAPSGIRKGDVVVSLNGTTVKTPADFSRELDATKVGDTLTVALSRDGAPSTIRFPRPQPKAQIRMVR